LSEAIRIRREKKRIYYQKNKTRLAKYNLKYYKKHRKHICELKIIRMRKKREEQKKNSSLVLIH